MEIQKSQYEKKDNLVISIELFEKNHQSLHKLEYYYNCNKGEEVYILLLLNIKII